jgi:hypothetical protein
MKLYSIRKITCIGSVLRRDGVAFGIYAWLRRLSNAVNMTIMGAAVSKCERQVHREIKLKLLNVSN